MVAANDVIEKGMVGSKFLHFPSVAVNSLKANRMTLWCWITERGVESVIEQFNPF
jgi:hypothetical protein